MKKLFIAVIIILTATLLIAPKFIGSTVEQERGQILTQLNKTAGIHITTISYEDHWFGADVSSLLTVNLEEEGLSELTLQLEEELSFGPIISNQQGLFWGLGYSVLSFKITSTDIDTEVIELINEKIHLSALLDFDSNVTTFISTDEFSYEDQGSSIVSLPSTANFTLLDNKKIKGSFSWGGLELNELGDRFIVGKIAMSTEQEVVSGDYFKGTAILIGDAKVTIEKINMFEQEKHSFSLNYTELASTVSINNDALELNIKYHAKDLSASGQYYEKPSLAVELSNVDLNALKELNSTMANLSSPVASNDNTEELLQVLSKVTAKLLAKDPTLKVTDLSVVSEYGKISTIMNFMINKDLIDTNNLQPMSFILALEAEATGKAPIGFLTKLGVLPMIDGFVQQGYLTKQENDISFDAKYQRNELTLNNKPFQL